jgi:hypothetical protein
MEEIKVGEYCRIRGGHIRKVTKIMPVYENDLLLSDSYWITFDNLGNIGTYKNKQLEGIIVAHSPNIIDLIQVRRFIIYRFRICLVSS